jgi:hypothetical protein
VADPSLTVGPCLHEFGWSPSAFDCLAGATVAGHLIECGTQVTGGISTDWLDLPEAAHIGFPIVEINSDGSCTVTKPKQAGGCVNLRNVKEQLLYEIGDPSCYLSPDVTVSFLTLQLESEGLDRVSVQGASGRQPSDDLKVSATFRNGYWTQATLTIIGHAAAQKARRVAEIIIERVMDAGFRLEHIKVECLGAGELIPGAARSDAATEVVLRMAVADSRREAVERFSREFGPMITAGPQGITGYAAGRPKVHPVFGYWPCLIPKADVKAEVQLLPVS